MMRVFCRLLPGPLVGWVVRILQVRNYSNIVSSINSRNRQIFFEEKTNFSSTTLQVIFQNSAKYLQCLGDMIFDGFDR